MVGGIEEEKWAICSTPTGFQIIFYHRYDSCNYVRFLNYIAS